MSKLMLTELNILIPLAFAVVGLLMLVLIDPYISRKHRRIMLIIVAIVSILLIREYVDFYVEHVEFNRMARIISSIIGYVLRPVVLVMFCYIVDIKRKHIFEWILIIINTLIHMTALFTDICFGITDDNNFTRGPLGFTSHVVSIILLVWFVYLTIRKYAHVRKREMAVQLFNALLVVVASMLDSFGGDLRYMQVSLILAAIVITSMIQYIWLHLQYVREHEMDIIAGYNMKIMVSQMQPHFIYNSLTAIKAYLDEPDKAEEALDNFTGFLRGSIDLLAETECVPFEKELDTVKNYLYLQKERFGDKLNVIYDITDTNYLLPAFTIQTLVENAVSHGIRRNPKGAGTLTIRCYQEEDMHVIVVEDDGVGFDVDKVLGEDDDLIDDDSHIHVGLRNMRDRLEYMCNGELSIISSKGEGTKAYVWIDDSHAR